MMNPDLPNTKKKSANVSAATFSRVVGSYLLAKSIQV